MLFLPDHKVKHHHHKNAGTELYTCTQARGVSYSGQKSSHGDMLGSRRSLGLELSLFLRNSYLEEQCHPASVRYFYLCLPQIFSSVHYTLKIRAKGICKLLCD